MAFPNTDVILLDSDSESEVENPPKKLKLQSSAVTGPPIIPPMKKPFMEESDYESESSEKSSSGSVQSAPENGRADQAAQENGAEYGVPKMSDSFGRDTTRLSPAPDGGIVPESVGETPESSDSGVESSELEEISPSELIDPKENGEVSIARLRSVYETRKSLKRLGVHAFLKNYLPETATSDTILELLRKLGYVPRNMPPEDSGSNLYELVKLLYSAMERVRNLRPRLENFTTIPDVLQALRTAKKILVLTGAGISTSLGIPDFRSSQGFYSQISHFGLDDPQEVFDISLFRQDPSIFYSVAHMILPPENVKAPLHKFLKLLQDRQILLRNYSQNIENIEANAGILPEKIVQCHGSFATATCITCHYQVEGHSLFPQMRQKEIPYCPRCAKQRKKLMNRDNVDVEEGFGVMKPDITFFGEQLPEIFHQKHRQDLRDCDLLISIGTSLRVAPVADMVDLVPENVPQILINRDPIPSCNFDVSLLGYCDDIVSYLCDQLGSGWEIDHPEYPTLVGENHDNLAVVSTDEKGVFHVKNKKRDAENAGQPPKEAPGPDLVVLAPTFE